MTTWPEIDKAAFFTIAAAREKLKLAQQPLLDRLMTALAQQGAAAQAEAAARKAAAA